MLAANDTARSRRPRTAVVGLYAWLAAVWFGAVLFDVLYARQGGVVPAGAADLLAVLWVVVGVVGFAAVAAAWSWPSARSLLLASAMIMGFEVLVPVMAAMAGWDGSVGAVEIGPWLRLGASGAVAVAAFLAFRRLSREGIDTSHILTI